MHNFFLNAISIVINFMQYAHDIICSDISMSRFSMSAIFNGL